MLMDSKLQGVPVSATEAAPPTSTTVLYSTFSTGIRAPLTIDDSDFEYSLSGDDNKDGAFSSNESDTGLESDGFLSGEDGSETAGPDNKILEVTHFVREYVVSAPSLKTPRVGINKSSSFDRNFEDSRHFSRQIDERIVEEKVVDEGYNRPWPFSADACEEAVGTSVEEDENASLVRLPGVSNGSASMNRPIAKLSRDTDDDDYESNGSVEDEPFLGVARDSSSGKAEKLGSAPKVRILEAGGGDDSPSLSDSGSEGESVEDTFLVGDESGDNGLSNSCFQEKQIADDLIAAEAIEDKGPFIAEEARGADSCDEIQEFNMNTIENSVEYCDDEKNSDTTNFFYGETKILNIFGTNGVKKVVCDFLEVEVTGAKAKDGVEGASMDYGNCEDRNIDGNGTVSQPSELDDNGDLESEIEQKTDQKLVNHDTDAPKYLESMDSIRESDIQLMNNVKFLDSQVFQEPGCLWNGHSVDVMSGESSESDLQAIDAGHSGNVLDVHSRSEREEVYCSFLLEEPLRASTGVESESSDVDFTSSNSTIQFPLKQPDVIDSRIPASRPTAQQNPALFTGGPVNVEPVGVLTQEEKTKLEKLQEIVVKFLRLFYRLQKSPEDSVAVKVLHQLLLAAGRPYAKSFNVDFAKQTALVLEAEGKNDFNFSLNILVIGKSGVGKSATINSIFGEEKARIDAFELGTTSVKEITGTLDGIHIRVLDTPGLSSSLMEQSFNYKVLSSIKKFTKKFPPDVILYVDRLDTLTRDLNDLHLLKLITSALGSSIWSRTIVTLTHAASVPPEGPSGDPLSYGLFVAKISHVVQQLISHSVGNFATTEHGLVPVSLIENNSMSGMEKNEQAFLCSKESWRFQLLILCFSMKILSEIDSVVNTNKAADYQKLFGFKVPSPSLTHFMASFLQSTVHPKPSTTKGSRSVDSDIEFAYSSDCDQESDGECDLLPPPFKPLNKSESAKLSKEQRNAYFEEYDYRVKLLDKTLWNEQVKMFQDAKKQQKVGAEDNGYMEDNNIKMDSPGAVAAPLPGRVLPSSFGGENPSYRYLSLEPSSWFLAMPVVYLHGWDHDCGYDGLSIEDNLTIAGHFPAVVAAQIRKDKNEFNINLNSSVSVKHWEKGSTYMDTAGVQLVYILKMETKLRNFKENETAAGVTIASSEENLIAGLKVEDQLALAKHLALVGSTGLIQHDNDTAYGAMLGIWLREKNFPIGQGQILLGLSLTRWRGELACGLNLQSQFSMRRDLKLSVRTGLNGKRSGMVSVRLSSSDQPLLATLAFLPIIRTLCRTVFMLLSHRWREQ